MTPEEASIRDELKYIDMKKNELSEKLKEYDLRLEKLRLGHFHLEDRHHGIMGFNIIYHNDEELKAKKEAGQS